MYHNTVKFGSTSFFNLAGADMFIVKIGDTLQQVNVAGIYEANGLSIYPNPSAGALTLETNGRETSFVIQNMYGREVYRFATTEKKYPADLSFLPNGMYLLRAESGTQRAISKLIIQK